MLRLYATDRAAYLAARRPREKLGNGTALRFLWIPRSHNRKLGAIPSCFVSSGTCPPSCAFYGQGCYAEFGHVAAHWARANRGISLRALIALVRLLPRGQLWRYAVAGDLPGNGDELHVGDFGFLVAANELAGAKGFAFTHKPLRRSWERTAIRQANEQGFTVNLSADSLEHADERAVLGVGPVAVVVPSNHPRHSKTPAGRHVIVCPAQTTEGMSCDRCRLCAKPRRKAIVAFRAHGQFHRAVSKRVLPIVA